MIAMNIVCALCGRHVPEHVFDPSDFEDDIYAVYVTGLGRGRGFSASEPFSILDDKRITGLIADRCHRILNMIEKGSRLPKGELDALRTTLESWTQYARNLEKEQTRLNKRIADLENQDADDELEEYVDELLEKINVQTNFNFETLEEAIGFLLEN
jgi:hypothetical protein